MAICLSQILQEPITDALAAQPATHENLEREFTKICCELTLTPPPLEKFRERTPPMNQPSARNRHELFASAIEQHIKAFKAIDGELLERILQTADLISQTLRSGGRVMLAGNGGSAADAQHTAAELVGRFLKEREPYSVMALTTNSSTLTCLLNDYPPEEIYSRQVRAYARPGDVFIGISTSGNSQNIVLALRAAKEKGAAAIGLTGETGGKLLSEADYLLNVPSQFTPRIQEMHIFILHMICQFVEEDLAK